MWRIILVVALLMSMSVMPAAADDGNGYKLPLEQVSGGWHPPGAHDGLNVHEHGDQPPSWVTAHDIKPFTQSRESHIGYKGAYAKDNGGKGVESYLIAHVLATESARSHGDHDYQIWLRYQGQTYGHQGVLDFSGVKGQITAPIPERTRDTGERPIALAERNSSDGCETWYSRPGAAAFDLGWTVCGRYQKFDGAVIGGRGVVRTIDWVIPASRLPAGHPLKTNCTVEFGVCRHSFIVNTKNYDAPGITPIN